MFTFACVQARCTGLADFSGRRAKILHQRRIFTREVTAHASPAFQRVNNLG